ncbi:UNVERIFIED_CONTAM: Glutamate receptor 2.8 [Sesamum latifolium]|uniref:Glutamate receptor 2.8 n=1 Tax=Sesamum latifolium TaxID=2727402 RepID=A0AAW2UCF8_9LAMI
MQSLPYAVQYEFIIFGTPDGQSAGDYNDLVHQIVLEEYDAVAGDISILANRSRFVDFSFPYTESGVSAIVPIKDNERENAWIFMKPLTMDLWLTIGAFFVFTGFVVWVLEHRVNKEFRGPRLQQVGMIFWFSFSTIVFAHKEKVISNLTRFVVIVWVFVVLVLTSSYTANLTSMLTIQQLHPTITDIHDLRKNGDFVGYQNSSYVREFLKGSRNGGVAAIVDELPYLRLFLDKYSHKYTMVGPTYKTAGLGFAFRRGSPLLPDVSRAIIDLREKEILTRISNKWLGEEGCRDSDAAAVKTSNSKSLTLDSFKGLFLISWLSSSSALAIFLSIFFYENRVLLASDASIKQKLYALARAFDEEKDILSSKASTTPTPRGIAAAQSPAISISYQHEEVFSQDEGFPTTEPGTPIHHATAG